MQYLSRLPLCLHIRCQLIDYGSYLVINSLKGQQVRGPTKKGCFRGKTISVLIFVAGGLGLEQTIVAIESYNIAMRDGSLH